ncbi:fimbria/pilus periplasmic chaperone [Citrobacter sp. Awk 4]|uniref:fimbrial biogenesis chaperone n=1 Tax=Citrobacter sp. Awk 4 TaxID=2963955 RepID=UPI002303EEA6|nr:fimbria/pilus periplasmic chaperone [Citrobacter sp. Awk 4]MDA8480075.1 fimbria/pilus periplasmic chaperone [Citrobacter sp. Awk 4]
MKHFKFFCLMSLLMAQFGFSTLSFAGLVLDGTRVIYPAGENEVTVRMKNTGSLPVLAQSWIDNGVKNETPDKISSVFVLTPPINRVNAGKGQTLRISLLAENTLPQDKESVFYLNVLAIPAKSKDSINTSQINIAFKTRIKIFYRPDSLKGSANDAPNLLRWNISGNGVTVTNPTPYYVTLTEVTYASNGKKVVAAGQMISPGGTSDFHFNGVSQVSSVDSIEYASINDFGGLNKYKVKK